MLEGFHPSEERAEVELVEVLPSVPAALTTDTRRVRMLISIPLEDEFEGAEFEDGLAAVDGLAGLLQTREAS